MSDLGGDLRRQTDNASSEENSPVAPSVLDSMRGFHVGFGRTKTRLIDRPPPTPAVCNQLNRCTSMYKNNMKASCQLPLASGLASDFPTSPNPIPKTLPTVSEISTPRKRGTPVQQSLKPVITASNVEEEPDQDPSDDDSIPDYKKKTNQESKWYICLQWTDLFLLIHSSHSSHGQMGATNL